jgi:hypothetical protein
LTGKRAATQEAVGSIKMISSIDGFLKSIAAAA